MDVENPYKSQTNNNFEGVKNSTRIYCSSAYRHILIWPGMMLPLLLYTLLPLPQLLVSVPSLPPITRPTRLPIMSTIPQTNYEHRAASTSIVCTLAEMTRYVDATPGTSESCTVSFAETREFHASLASASLSDMYPKITMEQEIYANRF
ncbi:hypothetical protein F5B20DRAFT_581290 [Whalleya microplaca]|nr:hypothetical protein F5B20DRAFT_581290 [Whalleya microplaca]